MSIFLTWLEMVLNHPNHQGFLQKSNIILTSSRTFLIWSVIVPDHQGFMNVGYYNDFLSMFCICFFMQKLIADDWGQFLINSFSVLQAIGDFQDVWKLCLSLFNILMHFYTSLLQVYSKRTLPVVKENHVSGLIVWIKVEG